MFFSNARKAESLRRSMEILDKYEACRLRSEARWNRVSGKPVDEAARQNYLTTRAQLNQVLDRYR